MSDEHRAATSGANVEARDVFGSVFAAAFTGLEPDIQAVFANFFKQLLDNHQIRHSCGNIINIAVGDGASATTVSQQLYVAPDALERMNAIRYAFNTFHAAPFKLPQRNRVFAGRDCSLRQLVSDFNQLANGSNTTEVVIVGSGGVGKSSLAIAYARDRVGPIETSCTSTADEWVYNYVIYFHGSLERLSHDINLLARELGFAFDENRVSTEVIARAVYRLLSYLPRVLFVVDGLDEANGLEELLPPRDTASFHCLYTSREHSHWQTTIGAAYHVFPLGVFGESGALDYFHKAADERLKAVTNSELDWLALAGPDKRLGGLPLALAQAMAYLKQEKISVQDYLKEFDECFVIFASCPSQDDYRYTVLTTWLITLPKLLALSSQAVEIFFSLAYLRGDEIPRGIIEGYCQSREGWSGLKKRQASINKQIRHLVDYSLITELDEFSVQMHQLLQESIGWWLSERHVEEMDDAKSSSNPKKVVAHQAQLIMIVEQIKLATTQGCQTNPYHLICTMGAALALYKDVLYEREHITMFSRENPMQFHTASLVQHMLLQPEFQKETSVFSMNSADLSAGNRLIAMLLTQLVYQEALTSNAVQVQIYNKVFVSLLEKDFVAYGPPILEFISILMNKASSQSSLRPLLAQNLMIWLNILLAQNLHPDERKAVLKVKTTIQSGSMLDASTIHDIRGLLKKRKTGAFLQYYFKLRNTDIDRENELDVIRGNTHSGASVFESKVRDYVKSYGLSVDEARVYCVYEGSSLAISSRYSEKGAKIFRLTYFMHGLLKAELPLMNSLKLLIVACAKLDSHMRTFLDVSPQFLLREAKNTSELLPLLCERFGKSFKVYFQAEEFPGNWIFMQRAAQSMFEMGAYNIACRYYNDYKAISEEWPSDEPGSQFLSLTCPQEMSSEILVFESQMAFSFLMTGRTQESAIIFQNFLGSDFFYEQHAVFYGCYLLLNGHYDEALVWLEVASTQEDFPILFNHWCQLDNSLFFRACLSQIEESFNVSVISSQQFAALLKLQCVLELRDMRRTISHFKEWVASLFSDNQCKLMQTMLRDFFESKGMGNIVSWHLFIATLKHLEKKQFKLESFADAIVENSECISGISPEMQPLFCKMLRLYVSGSSCVRVDAFVVLSAIIVSEDSALQTVASQFFLTKPLIEDRGYAIAFCWRAITSEEDIESLWFSFRDLAYCHWLGGEITEAEDIFQSGLAHAYPGAIQIEYAHFLYEQGRYDEAMTQLGKGLPNIGSFEISYGKLEVLVCEAGLRTIISLNNTDNSVSIPAVAFSIYLLSRCYERVGNETDRQIMLNTLHDFALDLQSRGHVDAQIFMSLHTLGQHDYRLFIRPAQGALSMKRDVGGTATTLEMSIQEPLINNTVTGISVVSEPMPSEGVPSAAPENAGAYEQSPAVHVVTAQSTTSDSEDDEGLAQQAGSPLTPH